jgi:hypothetical protein
MLFSLLSLFISLAERELTPPLLSAPLKKENSLKNTGREKVFSVCWKIRRK